MQVEYGDSACWVCKRRLQGYPVGVAGTSLDLLNV